MSAALLLAAALSASAQLQIHAEADKTAVALDDQIVLSVTVKGPQASLPDPKLPALPNFSVYSSGRSQNLSFVNGRISSSISHTFVLVPRFVGKGLIGPITVEHQGTVVQTAPIEVTVGRPGAAPATGPDSPPPAPSGTPPAGTGPDLFVTASLDKSKAFVDEPVLLTVRFHTAVNLLGNPQYQPPKLGGFIAEDLPPERHGNVSARGRSYYYSEIRTALFPAQAGKLTVGPAMVRAQVRRDLTVDPFAPDFFDRFFSGGLSGAETKELRSEPLVLEARPLPDAGKPAGFSGAVGRFSIAAAVDRSKVKVGEAVNLTVTVTGKGNLKGIADPPLPPLPDFRTYETVSTLNLDKTAGVVSGTKVFRTVLVPRVSGTLAIPAMRFSYFDPAREAYLWAETVPLEVKAAPGDPGTAPAGPLSAGPSGFAPAGLTSISEDIRYLKNGSGRSRAGRWLSAAAGAGPLHALPFLAFALALGLSRYEESLASDPAGRRARAALKTARAGLRRAEREGDAARRTALVGEALQRYLADRLGCAPAGLTLRRALELLRERKAGLDERLAAELRESWEELDRRRFAPPGAAAAQGALERRLEALLAALDAELGR